jgi:hypothetical protein
VSLLQTIKGLLFGLGDVFEEPADLTGRQVAGMTLVVKQRQTACPDGVTFGGSVLAEACVRLLADEVEQARGLGRSRGRWWLGRHRLAPPK